MPRVILESRFHLRIFCILKERVLLAVSSGGFNFCGFFFSLCLTLRRDETNTHSILKNSGQLN